MTLSLRRAALAATASALVALSAGQLVPSPSGAVAAPATSTAGDSIGRLPHERTVKPFSPGVVTIDPASITAGSPDVSVEVAPDATHADPVLTITATGEASVDEGAQAVPDGQPSDVSVGAALSDGEGAITATLTGTAPDGRTETTSDTVWVDTVDGTVVTSELGTQDLRLKAIDLREAKGLLTAEAADAFRAEATGGGADTVVAAGPDPSCVDICVSGTVRWTDSAGGTHPVRKAPVEVYDEEVGADQLIATAVTDDTGAYAFADFDTNDGPGEGGRDVYVRVLAAGPGFDVVGQHIDSPVTSNVRWAPRCPPTSPPTTSTTTTPPSPCRTPWSWPASTSSASAARPSPTST